MAGHFSVIKSDQSELDSAKAEYKTNEISVETTQILSKQAYKFNSTMKISRSEIEKIPGADLQNVIMISPGFFVKDYGGISGLKTVSLRGSASNQVQINLNGNSLNSAQSGSFDLSLFPKNFISNIELSRGGLSVEGNNNSVAGTMNLFIEPIKEKEINLSAAYGSFEMMNFDFNINNKILNMPISFFSSYQASEGNFDFTNNLNNVRSRENSDFQSINTAIVSEFQLYDFKIIPLIMIKYDDKGVPGQVLQDKVLNSEAKSVRKEIYSSISSSRIVAENTLINFSSGFIFEDFNYSNNDFLAVENNFYGRTFQFNSDIIHKIYFLTVKAGLGFEFASLNGDFLDKEVGSYVDRFTYSAYLTWAYENSGKIFSTDLIAGVKLNAFDKYAPQFTQNFGVITSINDLPIWFKLNFSRNYRLPSFNEMYYLNYGNSDLSPEESYSANASIVFDFLDIFNFEFTAFRIETNNLIVSIPKSPVEWSAQNIGVAVTNGLEANLKTNFSENFQLSGAYTLQNAKDKSRLSLTFDKLIPYIPQEIISGNMFLSAYGFDFSVNLSYSSHRFALPDNSLESLLDNYYEADAFIAYNFNVLYDFTAKFEVNNFTNQSYQIIKNFPMPGRYFNFSLGIKI